MSVLLLGYRDQNDASRSSLSLLELLREGWKAKRKKTKTKQKQKQKKKEGEGEGGEGVFERRERFSFLHSPSLLITLFPSRASFGAISRAKRA